MLPDDATCVSCPSLEGCAPNLPLEGQCVGRISRFLLAYDHSQVKGKSLLNTSSAAGKAWHCLSGAPALAVTPCALPAGSAVAAG